MASDVQLPVKHILLSAQLAGNRPMVFLKISGGVTLTDVEKQSCTATNFQAFFAVTFLFIVVIYFCPR